MPIARFMLPSVGGIFSGELLDTWRVLKARRTSCSARERCCLGMVVVRCDGERASRRSHDGWLGHAAGRTVARLVLL
jgi:hypothetical protein